MDNQDKPRSNTTDLAKMTKAVADPARIEILKLLAQGAGGCCGSDPEHAADGICLCDIVTQTGLIQSLVSYHMKTLRDADLVVETQRGKWKHYRINPGTAAMFVRAWSEILCGR